MHVYNTYVYIQYYIYIIHLDIIYIYIYIYNICLYRDDGLGVFPNIYKPEVERKKKQIVKIFKEWIIYHHLVQLEIHGLFGHYLCLI